MSMVQSAVTFNPPMSEASRTTDIICEKEAGKNRRQDACLKYCCAPWRRTTLHYSTRDYSSRNSCKFKTL